MKDLVLDLWNMPGNEVISAVNRGLTIWSIIILIFLVGLGIKIYLGRRKFDKKLNVRWKKEK